MHVYGVTLYWDPKDELGFNYREPTLSFDLKHDKLNISDRDLQLGNLDDVLKQL
jgi:dTDP-4-dehydrorhamnose 3,5-epimerase-like enzyme